MNSTTTRKSKIGVMTVVSANGNTFAIFSPTRGGLVNAFNAITNGRIPFDETQVDTVRIQNRKNHAR